MDEKELKRDIRYLLDKKKDLVEEKKKLIEEEKDFLEEKKEFIEEKRDLFREKDLIEKREENIINYLKKKKDWIVYFTLSIIIYISVYIRTRNIPLLKDITTGTWTLGPDLDPFLFLRWAKYIVEHGSLMALDTMRYVPLGFNTSYEMKLLPYMIAWFHNILSFFSLTESVTYSAIIFPVFMAALTAIAFFLFARKIFYKESENTKNIIALIATLFFVLIPSLLTRTIAGIPEKESAAFFFMFMAFYLFLEAFTAKKFKNQLILGVISGIITGMMALVWGGVTFVFTTIPPAILLAFIFGKIKYKEFAIYSSWLIVSLITMISFSTKYYLIGLINSPFNSFGMGVLGIILLSLIFMKNDKLKEIRKKTKLPKELFYLMFFILILLILVSIFFGPNFIFKQVENVKDLLISPMTTRFGLTVAENKQPYFLSDWKGSFGPIFWDIPLFFWLSFIGSIFMFNHLIKKLGKKEKLILTFSYFVFLFCLIFSRYSQDSILNGTNGLSLFMYFGGALFFFISFAYFYYKRYKEHNFSIFKEFNFAYILYFIILTIGIIGARGGVRLIMVLGAVSPIAISFLIVKNSKKYFKEKENTKKFFIAIIAIIIILASIFTLWNYYQTTKSTAENFAPGGYQMQWQKTMSWVRENTPVDAVFAHWWDYGYWIQSIGERATILDGSNSIIYWNHLMGRHVLTGTNEKDALEFLYAHNATHLLIDPTDIGKYTAYSSIGADEDYDRFSWINTFTMDGAQTQETKDETIYFYRGGTVVDEDIIWNEDGKDIFLPKKKAVVGAIFLKMDSSEKISQPEAIFVYNQQYKIPLRYAYYNGELHDFKSGLEAGIFIYPQAVIKEGQLNINKIGALLYLSKRTIHSHLANLYLFGKESNNFRLAHSEKNFIIKDLENQGISIGDFLQYQGFQGPIKIWEINYPSNTIFKQEYLGKEYPDEIKMAKKGEY